MAFLNDNYGMMTSDLAAQYIDAVQHSETGGIEYPAEVSEQTDVGKVAGSVDWAFRTDDPDGPDYAIVMDKLLGSLDRHIMAPARDTVYSGSKEHWWRYARVPQGLHPCGFCIMLAGRGFVYASEDKASNGYHDHCHCTAVAGFGDDPKYEGYDPEAYRTAWEDAERTVGLDRGNMVRLNNAITAELARRDAEWIRTGKAAPVDYQKKRKKLSEGERNSVDVLSRKGISVTTIRQTGGERAHIDFLINGEHWEEKSPLGNSRSSVFENLADVVSKWNRSSLDAPIRVVYSNAFGSRPDEIVLSEISSMIGELGIKEVLFITKGGSMRRIS
jgi:hypothetical protein